VLQGRVLHELYQEASTPYEWHKQIFDKARELGMDAFSSPFDDAAVDFLETLDVPCYKIASFECTCIPLLKKVASTGKPVIMSTGMASLGEIEEAVTVLRDCGVKDLCLMKCTSAYPCPPEEMNLNTIPHLSQTFNLPVGISDHTLEACVSVAGVALGACLIEKHLTISRAVDGPDSAFSSEPEDFKRMIHDCRTVEAALGKVKYAGDGPAESKQRGLRRSLFVAEDMSKGDTFNQENLRNIRPGAGIHTRHYDECLGQKASQDIARGTPMSFKLVATD